jgi:hypothetical protein
MGRGQRRVIGLSAHIAGISGLCPPLAFLDLSKDMRTERLFYRTSLALGLVALLAAFGGKSAGRYVMVLPAGTFRLSGTVKEDGLPVSGAQVAVSVGPAQGLATTTADGKADSAAGYYFLYGVVGDVEISVTKPGYTEQRKSVRVTAQQSLDFALAPSAPRDIVDGNYTFTLSAAAECRSTLPAELLERRYSVFLSQAGPAVTQRCKGHRSTHPAPRRTTAFAAPSSRTG